MTARTAGWACLAALLAACASPSPPAATKRPAAQAAGQPPKAAPAPQASGAAGTLVGGALGRGMSAGDRAAAADAERRALVGGLPVQWSGDKARGRVRVLRSYDRGGTTCRDFVHTVTVDEVSQDGRGTACRQPDGGWKMTR